MQKTLGGDRLGSGNKLKVDLHGYERSTHDKSYIWRSTMSAGTLVPFIKELVLPGDTFDINLNCDIKTHPTIGPLFGSYKVQLDVFLAPIRLYNSLLHNNALGIGMNMEKVKFPVLNLGAIPTPSDVVDYDNIQVNPSCILSYLGIRGVGINNDTDLHKRKFNAIPYLAYWEIYKNYYANKQEEIGAVIHTPAVVLIQTVDTFQVFVPGATTFTLDQYPTTTTISTISGTTVNVTYVGSAPLANQIIVNTSEFGDVSLDNLCYSFTTGSGSMTAVIDWGKWGDVTLKSWRYISTTDMNNGKPAVATFPLTNIDEMRKKILAYQSEVAPFDVELETDLTPYDWIFGGTTISGTEVVLNRLSSQEGLALKTYQSDLFNAWLNTEWIDGSTGINAITAIDTSGGSFTLDTLNLSKKVYDMLNRIAVSGGTYDDWQDAVWAHDRYRRAESPMYMGGLIKELVFQEVVSNTQSGDQPLGTLAGKGVMSNKHKGGNIIVNVDEPSYIIGIISLTPRIDYSQGNDWDITLQTLDDVMKPALQQIGFQETITEHMAWWDTEWNDSTFKWDQKSAGKQPAWINYMTSVNKTYGNFAIQDNEMFMTLNRRYEKDNTGIKDLTTYIDPSKFNFIFAETALDAQNFWAQIAVNITARRKMSAKVMPNL